MRLAVAVTVLNERSASESLLAALQAQTREPDEIVVVDAGSRDGTYEFLCGAAQREPRLRVLSRPRAAIGAGRNAAIAYTDAPAIAVTDAGCRPESGWLEALAASLDAGAAVVAGVFVPEPQSHFERLVSLLLVRPPGELSASWDPSSRSMAFTKEAWCRAGGYPEEVPTAEDTVYCRRLRAQGYEFVLQPRARVAWRPRSSFAGFVRQYRRYAYGDGLARVSVRHYALKIATYIWFVTALGAGIAAWLGVLGPHSRTVRGPLLVSWGISWVLYHTWFARKMLTRGAGWLALVFEPALMTAYDLAEIVGFVHGARNRHQKGSDA